MDELLKEQLPVMLTINELVNITGLSYYAIRTMLRENKVKYIKVGTKYFVNWDSYIDYINKGDN